jgi:hypothetical protein
MTVRIIESTDSLAKISATGKIARIEKTRSKIDEAIIHCGRHKKVKRGERIRRKSGRRKDSL